MFICFECGRRLLSKAADTYPFPESQGPCEICDKVRICQDVPSGADWAWKSTANETEKSKE